VLAAAIMMYRVRLIALERRERRNRSTARHVQFVDFRCPHGLSFFPGEFFNCTLDLIHDGSTPVVIGIHTATFSRNLWHFDPHISLFPIERFTIAPGELKSVPIV